MCILSGGSLHGFGDRRKVESRRQICFWGPRPRGDRLRSPGLTKATLAGLTRHNSHDQKIGANQSLLNDEIKPARIYERTGGEVGTGNKSRNPGFAPGPFSPDYRGSHQHQSEDVEIGFVG